MQRLNTLWQGALATVLALPMTAFAQGTPQQVIGNLGQLQAFLKQAFQWIYTIFFIIAAIMIIWAAFNYLTSGGDEEKVEKAKKQFIYAIVAIVVAILAVSVAPLIGSFFNVQVPPSQ